MDATTLGYTGKTNVQQMVSEIGALVGTLGDNERSVGESALNLRNLGESRSLTLINGRRFVSGFGGTSAVDLNTVPAALIERVDVLTGGASAIYGADAVTGVVNFVLKRDFEGLAFDAQYGDAERGDFRDQVYSLTAGRNFDGGRGNLSINYTYGERPNSPASSRYLSSAGIRERVNNPDGTVPQYVLMEGTREASYTYGGAMIDPNRTFSVGGFNGDGSAFQHGVNVGGYAGRTEVGGDGIPSWTIFSEDIRPSNERHLLTVSGHYDVSDAFKPYADIFFSDVKNVSFSQGNSVSSQPIAADTAYLPANVVAAAAAAGRPIVFNRWNYDAGARETRLSKRTFQAVLGAQGDLSDHVQYDASFTYGEMRRRSTVTNDRMYDRYLAAMDAVVDPASGQVTCRSNLDPMSFNSLKVASGIAFNPALGPVTFTAGANSGCVPYDPFTLDSSKNAQALAWIYQPTTDTIRNKLIDVMGYVTADSGGLFELPGGPVNLVLGGEYRKEKSYTTFDPLTASSRRVALSSGTNRGGRYDVTELFGEVSLPLLRDVGPLLRELTIDGAYRYSDYSTVGRTSTWKLGGVFATALGLRFRGTVSRAVRAPNIGELYTPVSTSLSGTSSDPCSIRNVNLGTATRQANCAAALTALGVNPATFDPVNTAVNYFPVQTGGNPNLKEETADTRTLGVVWQPPFIPRLTLSADYYRIEISDAVISPSISAIFEACYDAPTLDNVFCPLIGREAGTGMPNAATVTSVNVAKIYTSGWEFSGSYVLPTEHLGQFRLSGNASYLKRLDLQKTTLPVLTDDRGLFKITSGNSSPVWVVNLDLTWSLGAFDANYGFNYSSRTLRNGLLNAQRDNAASILDAPYVKAYVNHDLQIGYRFRDNSRFYIGVNNLTDEMPDFRQGSLHAFGGRQSYAGRTLYAGLKIKLNNIW
jgi:outer membrane receptor protein involved in Fe transport